MILCLSFLNITDTILLSDDKTVVVTQDIYLYKFITTILDKRNIFLLRRTNSSFKDILFLIKLYLNKKKLKAFANNFKDYDVFSFITSYNHEMGYFLKCLSNDNTIFYKPAVKLRLKNKVPSCLIKIKKYLIEKFYDLNLDYKCDDNNCRFVYNDIFFEKLKTRNLSLLHDRNKLSNYAMKLVKNPSDIIYFTGDIVSNGYMSKELYDITNKNIIYTIGNRSISIKNKCNSNLDKTDFYSINTLNEIYPGNLLIYCYKIVIAINSALLFEAANAGIKSICTIYLFDGLENTYQKSIEEYILTNLETQNKVNFPKSISELENLVNVI